MVGWTLQHGSCLDPFTGLCSLTTSSVDHVITDPPYEPEAHTKQRRVRSGAGVKAEPLPFAPMTKATRYASAAEMARVTRRWVIVFCQVEAVSEWIAAMTFAGLAYKRTAIWVKPDSTPQFTGDRPGSGYESIVCAHKPGRSRWNGGGRRGVYTFGKFDPDRYGHPTQKPIALMEALVRDFTDPGDTICDPFAGSGTTGVAALRNGRQFVGWEMNEDYHRAASARLSLAREQRNLFAE